VAFSDRQVTGNLSNRSLSPCRVQIPRAGFTTVARTGTVVLAGLLLTALGRTAERGERPGSLVPGPARSGEFRGSGSCSAVACHGSIAPQPGQDIIRNEHTIWISDDHHSRAYQTLFDARSERIARSLAGDPSRYVPAHEDERCLACHATPRSRTALESTAWMNSDGVGCESCHGPSARWLGPHTTSAWKTQRDAAWKEKLGLFNTKDLARRAEVCAGCHVGQFAGSSLPRRDVNHDLIAAGHPRLNFELSAFLANMPPHWREKGASADPVEPGKPAADLPARAWAVGQLVTLRASLELLSSRASAAGKREIPWPEFTEYGCFSCHHSLRDDAWRRRAQPSGARIGRARWGSWTTPLFGVLVEQKRPAVDARSATESVESLAGLAAEMSKTVPDPTTANRLAKTAADRVSRRASALAKTRFDAGEVEGLITAINRPEAWDRVESWDEAAQRYLALVPLRQAWTELAPARKADQDQLAARLEQVRARLIFPPGLDSPGGFEPGKLRVGR
jgi:hypothetical protein